MCINVIYNQRPLEHHLDAGPLGQTDLVATSQQIGGQSHSRSDAAANSGAFGSSGNSPHHRSGSRGSGNLARIFALGAIGLNCTFFILDHRILYSGNAFQRAGDGKGVSVGKNESGKTEEHFRTSADASRTL